jgi:hypothetical protein
MECPACTQRQRLGVVGEDLVDQIALALGIELVRP